MIELVITDVQTTRSPERKPRGRITIQHAGRGTDASSDYQVRYERPGLPDLFAETVGIDRRLGTLEIIFQSISDLIDQTANEKGE